MNKTTNKYDQLTVAFPRLLRGFRAFYVNDGWYDLIYTLCKQIHDYVNTYNDDVMYRQQLIASGVKSLSDYSAHLLEPITMPTVLEVKEKMGALRFYYTGGDKRIQHWVEFAEAMSSTLCDECGAPGVLRDDTGWIHVKCDIHEALYKTTLAGPVEG